jgi:hypothetical protein
LVVAVANFVSAVVGSCGVVLVVAKAVSQGPIVIVNAVAVAHAAASPTPTPGGVVLVFTEAVISMTPFFANPYAVVVAEASPSLSPLQYGLNISSMMSSTSRETAAARRVLREEEALSLLDSPLPLFRRRLSTDCYDLVSIFGVLRRV